jgi:predicted ATPase/DNA-binding CsgD family transcriptional regulator
MASIEGLFSVTQTIMQPSFDRAQAAPRRLPAWTPIMPTRFVGRRRELDEVSQLVKSTRLITLIGAAGCGKTRLAQRVADQVYPLYPEGVYWVELAPLDDPIRIPQALAAVLNIPEQTDNPVEAGVVSALQGRQVFIILDNCEHLLNDTARLVSELLTSTPVTVLATSREPLAIVGEQRYPVRPMALPDADLSLSELAENEAIELFIQRAQAVVPPFALTSQNGPVIASICRRLDGIPLALELAAARLNVLTVEQIAAHLDDRFNLFVTAPHLTLTQHQTLYAAIEWSDRLLSPNEQAMLRRMAVFAAGCSLEIAVAVCGEDGPEHGQALTILSSLVDKSLVVADTMQGSEARYHLLEIIRQYAREKLIAAGEWDAIHTRLLDYFVERSRAISLPSPFAQIAPTDLAWLEREYDNIRLALTWALEHHQIEAGLSIANAVYALWDVRNTVREGRLWYERFFMHLDDTLPLALRVIALTQAAYLAMFLGDPPAAFNWSRAAVALCESAGNHDPSLLSYALSGIAGAARAAGDVATLFQVNERIIQLQREAGDTLALGMSYYAQGVTTMILGEYQTAHQLLNEALLSARRDEDITRLIIVLNALGDLARFEGNFVQAVTCYEESLVITRKIGAVREMSTAEIGLARAWLRSGEFDRAYHLLRQNLSMHHAQADRYGILQGLAAFSAWAASVGLLTVSVRLMAVVSHHEDSRQALLDSAHVADQRDDDLYREHCLQQLGAATFEAEYNIGKILSLDQAVEFALNLAPPVIPAAAAQGARISVLTKREREIVALIGRGFANGEIADTLVLSKRTVEKHIANILSKLDFTTRSQLIRWAVENDLTALP